MSLCPLPTFYLLFGPLSIPKGSSCVRHIGPSSGEHGAQVFSFNGLWLCLRCFFAVQTFCFSYSHLLVFSLRHRRRLPPIRVREDLPSSPSSTCMASCLTAGPPPLEVHARVCWEGWRYRKPLPRAAPLKVQFCPRDFIITYFPISFILLPAPLLSRVWLSIHVPDPMWCRKEGWSLFFLRV